MKMQGPYWVYTHTTPDGMVYVGMSSRKYTGDRWSPCYYKNTSLEPFIEEFGWENIEHFFIDGIQTRESALKLENDLIQMYNEKGVCINKKRSGLIFKNNKKEYQKEYRENNKEELKEYEKEYREEHKEHYKEYYKQYYEKNKEELKEYQKQYVQRKKPKNNINILL